MSCDQCEDYLWTIRVLRDRIEELEKSLKEERKKTDDHESVKRDRDELQAAANRRYDNYVSTPKDMP